MKNKWRVSINILHRRILVTFLLCICAIVSAEGDPVVRKALLIGIDKYPGLPKAPLIGCSTDVQLFQKTLLNHAGFGESDIKVLLNDQATHAGIVDAFHSHLTSNAAGATLVFYFSGHGSATMDTNDDEKEHAAYDWWDETLIPFDSRNGEGPGAVYDITDDEFQSLLFGLYKAGAAHVAVILDSCGSGVGESPYVEPGGIYEELVPDWDFNRVEPVSPPLIVPGLDPGMLERQYQSVMSLPAIRSWATKGLLGDVKPSDISFEKIESKLETIERHIQLLAPENSNFKSNLKKSWARPPIGPKTRFFYEEKNHSDEKRNLPNAKLEEGLRRDLMIRDSKQLTRNSDFRTSPVRMAINDTQAMAVDGDAESSLEIIDDIPDEKSLYEEEAITAVKGADWDERIYPSTVNFPKPDWGNAGSSTNMPIVFVFAAQVGQLAVMTTFSDSTQPQSVFTRYLCIELEKARPEVNYEDLISSVYKTIVSNHIFRNPPVPGAVGRDSKTKAFRRQ